MKRLFALLCLAVAGTANAAMTETVVIWNNTHWNEFQGVHVTDDMRTKCRIDWAPADHFIYDTAEFWCRLYIGDIGPGVPGTEVFAVYAEDPSPYTSISVAGEVVYEENDAIVPGCGDRKWRLEMDWEEVREPDNQPPSLESDTAVMTKVITWVQ